MTRTECVELKGMSDLTEERARAPDRLFAWTPSDRAGRACHIDREARTDRSYQQTEQEQV